MKKVLKEIISFLSFCGLALILSFIFLLIFFLGLFEEKYDKVPQIQVFYMIFYPIFVVFLMLFIRKIFKLTSEIDEARKQKLSVILQLLLFNIVMIIAFNYYENSFHFSWNHVLAILTILALEVISFFIILLKKDYIVYFNNFILLISAILLIPLYCIYYAMDTNHPYIFLLLFLIPLFLIKNYTYVFLLKFHNKGINIKNNIIYNSILSIIICFCIYSIEILKEVATNNIDYNFKISIIVSIILTLILPDLIQMKLLKNSL